MSELKRFHFIRNGHDSVMRSQDAEMAEGPYGDYVRYEDAQAQISKLERSASLTDDALKLAANDAFKYMREVQVLRPQIESQQAQITQLKEQVEAAAKERAEQWNLRRDAEADRDTKSAVIAELREQLTEANKYHLAYVAEMQDGYVEVINGLKAKLAQPAVNSGAVPTDVLDLARFMAQTWHAIDKWAYTMAAHEGFEHYPVIQGTSNQLRLMRIGEQPYDLAAIHRAIDWMLAPTAQQQERG